MYVLSVALPNSHHYEDLRMLAWFLDKETAEANWLNYLDEGDIDFLLDQYCDQHDIPNVIADHRSFLFNMDSEERSELLLNYWGGEITYNDIINDDHYDGFPFVYFITEVQQHHITKSAAN